MKFVTYNIHYGFGRDGVNSIDRIAETVDGADVIALQEVERFWPRSGMVDQVARLAKLLPDYWLAYGPTIDLHSQSGFAGEPNTARRQFGNLLLSRSPILSTTSLRLPRPSGEQQTMQRGAVEAVIDSAGFGPVRVYSTHLDYLSPKTRATQLAELKVHHLRSVAEGGAWQGRHAVDDGWLVGDEPTGTKHAIVLGDMNMPPVGAEYAEALATFPELVDAWPLGGGADDGATKDGERIDHCWITPELATAVSAAWIDQLAAGSDHQPAWFEIAL